MARIEKVNAMVKKEISSVLQFGDIKDPRIKFVTVLSVDVSKDLQVARVRFSTLSDDPIEIQNAIEGLASCRGYIRKLIGQRIEMRYTPEITFIYDKGVQHAQKIDMMLAEIKKHDEGRGDE